MKYLRRIFERLTDEEYYELKEECETYLAYLLDDDFEVDMSDGMPSLLFDIDIRKSNLADENYREGRNYDQFLWDDVKDHVIPLIELFRKGHFKYKLEKVILYFADGGKREIRNDEDLDKVQVYAGGLSSFKDKAGYGSIICLTIQIKI
jgi:hypothetical protein